LLEELAANTIDRQLAKSDVQLGLEYVLGFGPPLPPRRLPPSWSGGWHRHARWPALVR